MNVNFKFDNKDYIAYSRLKHTKSLLNNDAAVYDIFIKEIDNQAVSGQYEKMISNTSLATEELEADELMRAIVYISQDASDVYNFQTDDRICEEYGFDKSNSKEYLDEYHTNYDAISALVGNDKVNTFEDCVGTMWLSGEGYNIVSE